MSLPPISRLSELTWAERRTLSEAALELTLARVLLLVVPFRWLSGWLRRPPRSLTGSSQPQALAAVARAVDVAGRHLPVHCSCLVRAVAGRRMLRRRGIGSTMHLGVTRTPGKGMQAHAWLIVGDTVVCGGDEARPFATVTVFSDEGTRQ